MSTTKSRAGARSKGVAVKKHSAPAPISPGLTLTTLPEALEALLDLERRRLLIPSGAHEHLLAAATHVVDAATDLGLTNAAELVTQQHRLLTVLTGVVKPEAPQKTEVAEQLHTYRNLMLALAAAATGSFNGDPTGLYQQMIKLPPRTNQLRRPMTDDEIVLARVVIFLESTAKPRSTRVTVYTLVEAGMTPGETPRFKLEDADSWEQPEEVLASGNKYLGPRLLPLDRFATVVLGRFTDAAYRAGVAPTKPLTYTRRPSHKEQTFTELTSKATASAQGVLDRMMKEAGLFNLDASATSIRLWRLSHALTHSGPRYAQELGGFPDTGDGRDRFWRTLGYLKTPARAENDHDEPESFL